MNTIFPQKLRNLFGWLKLPPLPPWLLDRIAPYVTRFGIWLSEHGLSIAEWGNRMKGGKP